MLCIHGCINDSISIYTEPGQSGVMSTNITVVVLGYICITKMYDLLHTARVHTFSQCRSAGYIMECIIPFCTTSERATRARREETSREYSA